ncbi:Yggs family pyridoxal phosphate enzyme, partial [Globisporangium splendens]
MASSASVVRNLQVVREKVVQAAAKSAWKQQCTLVAVSKTKPIEDLQAAYAHDQRHFGENYIQELIQKTPSLPSDVKWHYIGHVQSNKAKSLVRDVPNLYMVETVDSIKIANALNRASGEFRTTQLNVLVQVNTSDEDQKSGTTSMDESVELAQHIVNSCEHLRLAGLMTIGRYGDTTSECFDRLVACRKKIAEALNKPETELDLSMGMSGDYELAISCGSTYVRVGSTIFGDRNYAKA